MNQTATIPAPTEGGTREPAPPLAIDDALALLELQTLGTPELIQAAHARLEAALAEPSGAGWTPALRHRLAQQRARLAAARDLLLEHADHRRVIDAASATQSSSTPDEPLIGTVLARRYEIIEFIGEGGMGRVFRAYDRVKQTYVAVKAISPDLVRQKGAQERFVTEARLACALSHPNIIRVHDVCAEDDGHFITMELLHGQTLRARMEQQKRSRRPFPLEQGLTMARELLAGLAFAHLHLVHRDIKPENIWVCDDGVVKLMDFGVAQALDGDRRSRTLQSVGSAYYVAPEQLRGLPLDHRADQYSLAVVLYELFAGRVPTGVARPLHEERPDLPAHPAAAVMRALSPSPEERFVDTDAFRRAFEHTPWLAFALPVSARGRRLLAMLVGAVLVAGAAGLVASTSPGHAFRNLHLFETSSDRDVAVQAQATVAQLLMRADAVAAERQATLNTLRERSARPNGDAGLDAEVLRGELDLWSGLLYPASAQISAHSRRAMADAALKEGRVIEARETFGQLEAWLAPRVATIPRLPELARVRAQALAATVAAPHGEAASAPSDAQGRSRAQVLFQAGDAQISEARVDEAIAAYRDAIGVDGAARQAELAHEERRNQATIVQVRAQAAAAAQARAALDAAREAALQREADRRGELVRAGRRFRDRLSSGGEGPLMVVDAGGSPEAGHGQARSESAVAATDLSQFFGARGRPSRLQEAASLYREGTPPVAPNAVLAADARDYAEWLSRETGERYRVAQTRPLGDLGVAFWVARTIAP